VLGGHDIAGATISSVDELDVATGTTRLAGALAAPTHGAAAAALGGRVLVFGGASSAVHDLVQRFDPRRRSTRVIARLPRPRADVTSAVVGHTVVLIGGFDGISPQRDVWAAGDGRHFRVIAKLPRAVRYPAVVAEGDCVYVLGGLISGGEYDGRFSDLIQSVCVHHSSAAIVGRLPTPVAHAMGALIAGRVLVLGGSTPRGPSAAILRFEPATGRVVRAGRLPYPLTDAAVATVHGTAYLLGGISTRPLASVIEVRLAEPGRHPLRRTVRAVLGGGTHVGSGVVDLATGFGSLWLSGFGGVTRLEPADGRVVAGIRTPGTGDYSDVAVGDRSVWVTSPARGVVYRIDPRTDRVIATVRLGGPVQGIAVGAGRVWVTRPEQGPGQLIAIDPRDDRVTRQPIEVGPGPGQVVYGLHAVWVQNTSPSSVVRVDPSSDRVTTVIATTPVAAGSPGPGTIAVGYGSLWSAVNGSLTQVDPGSGRVRSRVSIPRGVAVALGDGRVWMLAYPRSSSPALFNPIKATAALWEVDPGSGRVTGRLTRLGAMQPIALAAGRRALWIANYDSSTVTQIHLVARRAQTRQARRGSR
jgi:streptogramin lyase